MATSEACEWLLLAAYMRKGLDKLTDVRPCRYLGLFETYNMNTPRMVQSSVIAAKLCRTAGQIISLDSVFLRLICSFGGGCSLSG